MKEFKLSNDVILRYQDLPGHEIPIIFIHGLGCTSSFDYPQVASMACLSNHRCILIDLVGSGYSDKPKSFDYTIENHANYLEALLDFLHVDEFVIFGHSMGGAVSITLANLVSSRVKSLILSEANLDSGGGFFSKKIANYSEKDFIESGYKDLINESIFSGNTEWAAGLSNSSPIAIYRNAASLIKGHIPSWREIYYSLEMPKTYIYGSNTLPDPDYDELIGKNINVVVVPDAGHSMAWENPEGLALMIKRSI
ncbi:alpha/beta fold hydrolase [Vibrio sp. OCN044]|uniref:Alpha/beta fold hydrolase n=1 Tax=Vibrio tetraodonis subsp. pristinus TaxID=2695891 RepID=A0A6L8LTK2_9VIBR|nr:alpha/beta hydrolase [Vibrio tetraodonis]MYM59045.1 alpha/beta fold hydrolase [Vibrio tetraodonis subsp. pristinus]